jgi:hypothetical protein
MRLSAFLCDRPGPVALRGRKWAVQGRQIHQVNSNKKFGHQSLATQNVASQEIAYMNARLAAENELSTFYNKTV